MNDLTLHELLSRAADAKKNDDYTLYYLFMHEIMLRAWSDSR